ncbi:LysR family transcriptional regulator [Aliiroseovarius crassostreae]|uniref:LysR family transcriptional regulator n=1 Tax=Aliiroseovarius crassostreae TaxID=154981 RepID=A0A9Q9HFU8_9RHOB|nr:LysR family transcriptional regulator [Aliiroseovarius crassostreae]UWP96070.1 LysR family transcriptional regulator [Aliiroseovarius crassostreae]
MARRFSPSTSCLAAFEAVARLGSVSDAAQELDLTQSAVSRQVQKLEAQVGQGLFLRDRKRLVLTEPGARYAEEIRMALAQITNATIALQTNPEGGVFNLAILPSFGTHWLAPRLPEFMAEHPGITLTLSTRTAPFAFAGEAFHGAIHFGRDDWDGAGAVKLWEEQALAVGAPGLLAQMDGAEAPRLALETRPDAWAAWERAHTRAPGARPAMVVDQFATMLRAAQAGLGIALMPDFLVERALEEGSLEQLPGSVPVSVGSYYLVWPENGADYPGLIAFKDWLIEKSNQMRS